MKKGTITRTVYWEDQEATLTIIKKNHPRHLFPMVDYTVSIGAVSVANSMAISNGTEHEIVAEVIARTHLHIELLKPVKKD